MANRGLLYGDPVVTKGPKAVMRTIKVIILILLIAPALGLLAFGPRGGDDVPPGRVVVEYWEKWTGDEEQQMRQIVDAFNATVGRDKGIFVRYISTSSINQKTLVATAAGVPPDIAGVWDSNLVQFADQDAHEPLEDLAREHGITADTYKPVYWDGCSYKGHLWALVSTPAAVALHYNRQVFEENADALRGAGLDPYRAPRTLDELNAYADALTTVEGSGRVARAGYFPMEPGWYVQYTCYWFGGDLWDERTGRLTLTDPAVIRAYEWIQRFARKYGRDAANEFRSGFGNVYSPQNPFLTGQVLMVQQGPWMASYIGKLRPALQRLKWSPEVAMTKPVAERRRNFAWAAAPFPSAVQGLENVTYATFDALVIPRGARHKREAFEFIAYVNHQDVMERLCTLHCKNSPLAAVSQEFMNNHPNPYIDVFETLAASPNARAAPKIPILPEVVDELNNVAQRLTLLQTDAATALREAQDRLQKRYDEYAEKRRARHAAARY